MVYLPEDLLDDEHRREGPMATRGNEVLDALTAERDFLHFKDSALTDLLPENGREPLSVGIGIKGRCYNDSARLRPFRPQEVPGIIGC
jgi:hypothetical protein